MTHEFPSNQAQVEKKIGPEKPPKPKLLGPLVNPEIIGPLPHGEKAIATFNAGIVSIPNGQTRELSHFAIYRVMTSPHIDRTPDKTAYFGIQKFSLTMNGVEKEKPFFVDPKSLLLPEDAHLNPEDIRLTWDGKVVRGGLTNATENGQPEVAEIVGIPVYQGDTIISINFLSIQTAKQKRHDGTIGPVDGKNVQVEIGEDSKESIRFRPEWVDSEAKEKIENRDHFRTLTKNAEGLYEQVGEDGIYSVDPQTVIPEGNTFKKFGLNGKSINDQLRIDHVTSVTREGKIEYGFITIFNDGIGKPIMKQLLTYDDAVRLSGITGTDLTGDKKVIYSNGSMVIPYDKADGSKGQKLVMAVTLFDRTIVMLSYDVDELTAYAK